MTYGYVTDDALLRTATFIRKLNALLASTALDVDFSYGGVTYDGMFLGQLRNDDGAVVLDVRPG